MRRAVAAALIVAMLALAQPARDALLAVPPEAPPSPAAGAQGLVGSVLAGSFRPLLLTYLWIRGDVLYGEGRDEECYELYRFLHALYPGNERASDYVGWFLAFNLKSKAPDAALGWRWAETGLDMLLPSEEGPSLVADWVRKQCGQNAAALQRYAGPRWEAEKPWRARLRRFAARHFGEEMSRFAFGVRVLEGREGFADRGRRAILLKSLAYEEMLREGRAPHAAEAAKALRAVAASVADDPRLSAYFEAQARCLEAAAAGRVPEAIQAEDAYPVAIALWGRGAHGRDGPSLDAAAAILERLGLPEEVDLVRRWRAHVEDPARQPRPPLPFDGMP
jgi:hypothetical protein